MFEFKLIPAFEIVVERPSRANNLERDLNELGAEGWMPICVVDDYLILGRSSYESAFSASAERDVSLGVFEHMLRSGR